MAACLAESNGELCLSLGGHPPHAFTGLIRKQSICFRIFDVYIRLDANCQDFIDFLMSRLPVNWKSISPADVHRRYSVLSSEQQKFNLGKLRCFTLFADHYRLFSGSSIEDLYDAFESDLLYFVGQYTREMLFLHAGVVAWEQEAIVIPGRSYSGKTTLVRALLHAGCVYYSDEYAIVDKQGNVRPFPRRLSIRLEAGGLSRTPACNLGASSGGPPLAVKLVIVTRYRPEAQWRPKTLSPGSAMLRLLGNTLSARYCPDLALTILERMVLGATVCESERGDAGETASHIVRRI